MNYMSCTDVEMEAAPSTLPLGQSNTEKSTRLSALQRLAALAAIIAIQDQYAESDCDSDDSDSDSSVDSDYFSIDTPFRLRTASTPAVIGQRKMAESSQAATRRVAAQRMLGRSTHSINERLLCKEINHDDSFNLEYRGPVVMKGKPTPMDCWFLTRNTTATARDSISDSPLPPNSPPPANFKSPCSNNATASVSSTGATTSTTVSAIAHSLCTTDDSVATSQAPAAISLATTFSPTSPASSSSSSAVTVASGGVACADADDNNVPVIAPPAEMT